ncbi:aspartate/glutamate racemase family protein [Glaciecola petra]|uniref:Amino acid racemase n=1 Tax=Glaciecola petra TaxID=3075602 RepID=A0ABU2ZRJ2_9ALTE|nr:amino acid racemase [Aestuariibacter sp. P117]MDT0595240.1 amino acid racemase [Aestuariibacter sp. P117]
MKKLGLIGGTSWHSTIEYYREINQSVNNHFGDNTNPPLLVYTLNQSLIHRLQLESKWEQIAELLTEAALSLQKAGAQQLMFCANTPHKVYELVAKEVSTPILHISDATASDIKSKGIKKVCFIGTKYSMSQDFVTKRIVQQNIEVLVPQSAKVLNELHRIIQEELTYGKIVLDSKSYVLSILNDFINAGAKAVVLGCTEFPLMISQSDIDVPIFNTTTIHAQAGVNFILGKGN